MIFCVDCAKDPCECKGITSPPVSEGCALYVPLWKEIWLSEHCSTKDVTRLISDFVKTGRNPSSNLDQFVAFVFEAGIENERSK